MHTWEYKRILEKQLLLLSEESKNPSADLPDLTLAMLDIVAFLERRDTPLNFDGSTKAMSAHRTKPDFEKAIRNSIANHREP